MVAILHLLVSLVRHFRAPVRLPENVYVTVVIAQKNGTVLSAQKYQEQLTSQYDDVGMRCERDAFDTLFDCAPEKLAVVKKVWIYCLIFHSISRLIIISLVAVAHHFCEQAFEQAELRSVKPELGLQRRSVFVPFDGIARGLLCATVRIPFDT